MATDYTSFLDALSSALDTGDLLLSNPTTGRLPGTVEATLPAVIGKGVVNGVAALNGSGVPITSQGVPMAVVGTGSGQAAEAVATAAAITAANTAATAAATAAAGKVAAVNGTVTGNAFFATMPTVADLVALNLPNRTVFFTPGN